VTTEDARFRRRPNRTQRQAYFASLESYLKQLRGLRIRLEQAISRDGGPSNTVGHGWPLDGGDEWNSPVETAVLERAELRQRADPIRHHTSGACEALVAAIEALDNLSFHLAAIDRWSIPEGRT
jgi:hypothetical protein